MMMMKTTANKGSAWQLLSLYVRWRLSRVRVFISFLKISIALFFVKCRGKKAVEDQRSYMNRSLRESALACAKSYADTRLGVSIARHLINEVHRAHSYWIKPETVQSIHRQLDYFDNGK